MRPIWNGMISFGLVNIPVGLYAATDDQDLHMHLLHAKDHGRIRNQRVCSVDGQPVEYGDLVRAFEYEKGQYVELTDDELAKVKVEATDRIVIDDFVDESEIDPKYFDKPYYLLPGKKSDAPYGLLREALRSSGRIGIARIVIRSRERLAAVRVDGPIIMLDTMHFADEIRKMDAPAQSAPAVGKKELDMAKMLIDAMTTKFDPEKYHDTYREAVMELVEAKVAGKEIVRREPEREPTRILDLMSYLKTSIAEREKAKSPKQAASGADSTAPRPKAATAAKPRRATRRSKAVA